MVFRAKHNRYLAVMNDCGPASAVEIAERCCKNIERYTKFTVSAGVGGRVEETSELPDSYRQAHRALAHHLFTGGNAAIMYDDVHQNGSQEPLALEYKDGAAGTALRQCQPDRRNSVSHFRNAAESGSPGIIPIICSFCMRSWPHQRSAPSMSLVPYGEIQPLIQRFRAVQGTAGLPLATLQRLLLELCTEGPPWCAGAACPKGRR